MSGVIVTTAEELEALVERAVRKVIGGATAAHVEPSEVMTRAQVAKLLNVNPHQVPKLIRREGMPAHPFGKNGWRFVRSEILQWVARPKAEVA